MAIPNTLKHDLVEGVTPHPGTPLTQVTLTLITKVSSTFLHLLILIFILRDQPPFSPVDSISPHASDCRKRSIGIRLPPRIPLQSDPQSLGGFRV